MSSSYRATPEHWAQTECKSPNSYSGLKWSLARCILELRAWIEALEDAATCLHIRSSDEGTSYCALAEQQAAAAPPEPAPVGSLVDQMAYLLAWRLSTSRPGTDCTPFVRDMLRAVAEWLNKCGEHQAVATLLKEAER